MSKIAIVSQPGQGVVIDVSGCASAEEAAYHLSSTLQVPNGFWNDMDLDLNFGNLDLDVDQARRLLSVAGDAGVVPRQVLAASPRTRQSLAELDIEVGGANGVATDTDTQIVTTQTTAPFLSEELSAVDPAVDLGITTKGQQPGGIRFGATGMAVMEKQPAEPIAKAAGKSAAASPRGSAPSVLYLKQTLRSGQSVNHKGHLVIVGDVNPGAEVMADGDITVWGSLRGVAHAGVSGNTNAEIRALRIEAIQLRIAQAIARAPDRNAPQLNTVHLGPETARMSGGVIRITSNALFHDFSSNPTS